MTSYETQVRSHLSAYINRSWLLASWHLGITVLLYILCLYANSWYIVPLLAGVYIRFFFIFHDLAHNSFFPNKSLNRIFGYVIATIIKLGYLHWMTHHEKHHRTVNDLTFNIQQTASVSKQDLEKESRIFRLFYRMVYSKYVLMFIVPSVYIWVVNRFVSTLLEIALFGGYYYTLYIFLGWSFVYMDCAAVFLAGMFEFIMLHGQHTFETAYRKKKKLYPDDDEIMSFLRNVWGIKTESAVFGINKPSDARPTWNPLDAILEGTAIIQIPWWLKFFTYNIEYHHIHHLNSMIPGYNLHLCHIEGEKYFENVKRSTLWEVISSMNLTLHDGEKRLIVGFE